MSRRKWELDGRLDITGFSESAKKKNRCGDDHGYIEGLDIFGYI